MAENRRLRIGVIGCGGIAQMMHLPHLRELGDLYDVVALSDVNPIVLNAVGDYYGVEERYANYQDLLRADLDAVMILTGGTHAPMVVEAANQGKHIFSEKPLCYTLREVDAIEDALARNRVSLMVGYMKRYDPAYRYGQRLVREMTDLRFVRITVLHPASELYFTHHTFQPPMPNEPVNSAVMGQRQADSVTTGPQAALLEEVLGADAPTIQRIGLGIMLGSLCHDVNALRGLLGEPEAVSHTELWNDGMCVSSNVRYPGGVRAQLTWTYLPHLRDYNEEIACFGDSTRVKIVFPSPFLRNEPTRVRVQGTEPLADRSESASWEKEVLVSYHEAFKEELLHFYDCIVNGKGPLTDLADSRADLQFIHALARAWKG